MTAAVYGTPPRFTSMDLEVFAAAEDPGQMEKRTQTTRKSFIMVNKLQGTLPAAVRGHAPPAP